MARLVKFRGIDRFNRPCFKRVGDTKIPEGKERAPSYFYGCTHILFNRDAEEAEVLEKVSEKDLVFFGNTFGCEPDGDPAPADIKIVRTEEKQ